MKSSLSAAGLFMLPSCVSASVFGRKAPSNRITLGFIGLGNMGQSNLKGFQNTPGCEVVAVCDADSGHLEQACKIAGLSQKSAYRDFRELLARPDIDAAVISTPDHWHAMISLAAVHAGKDVYCEKPLTLTIGEGRKLCDAVKQFGSVFQVGSHQRSDRDFRFACELIRNGRVGRIKQVTVEIPPNNRDNPILWKPEPVPAELDYDMWLGPAPQEPYVRDRCHYTFRFISDYSGGQVTNWGAHHLDIVQWALNKDQSGPVRVSGKGRFPKEGLFDTAEDVFIEYNYDNDVAVFCKTNSQTPTGNIFFEGDEGKIWVSREKTTTWPENLKTTIIRPDEIQLYQSDNHRKNFLDCIRLRRQPVAGVEIGHRSATLCHLGNIAMQIGEQLHWDCCLERFTNIEPANRLLNRSARMDWSA